MLALKTTLFPVVPVVPDFPKSRSSLVPPSIRHGDLNCTYQCILTVVAPLVPLVSYFSLKSSAFLPSKFRLKFKYTIVWIQLKQIAIFQPVNYGHSIWSVTFLSFNLIGQFYSPSIWLVNFIVLQSDSSMLWSFNLIRQFYGPSIW